MSALSRILASTIVVALWLAVFGFVLFATNVTRGPADADPEADGIVVLTGGDFRIEEGARLLREGRGGRLLITGVNPRTSRADLIRISGLPGQKFECCVDIDYEATDTFGNATETRTWALARRIKSLVVVTASYHMPRSLAELARALPETRLIPHPVVPKGFQHDAWWLHPATARILLSEYVKFLPVAAHLAAVRILEPLGVSSSPDSRREHRAGL